MSMGKNTDKFLSLHDIDDTGSICGERRNWKQVIALLATCNEEGADIFLERASSPSVWGHLLGRIRWPVFQSGIR